MDVLRNTNSMHANPVAPKMARSLAAGGTYRIQSRTMQKKEMYPRMGHGRRLAGFFFATLERDSLRKDEGDVVDSVAIGKYPGRKS
jgi:hypothetical protein